MQGAHLRPKLFAGATATAGSVTITATATEGFFYKTKSITVVNYPVTAVGLDKNSATIGLKKTVQLNVSIVPSNAYNKEEFKD